jgi:hypothetical protein
MRNNQTRIKNILLSKQRRIIGIGRFLIYIKTKDKNTNKLTNIYNKTKIYQITQETTPPSIQKKIDTKKNLQKKTIQNKIYG